MIRIISVGLKLPKVLVISLASPIGALRARENHYCLCLVKLVYLKLSLFILTKCCFWYRDAEEIPLTYGAVLMVYLYFGTIDSDNWV